MMPQAIPLPIEDTPRTRTRRTSTPPIAAESPAAGGPPRGGRWRAARALQLAFSLGRSVATVCLVWAFLWLFGFYIQHRGHDVRPVPPPAQQVGRTTDAGVDAG